MYHSSCVDVYFKLLVYLCISPLSSWTLVVIPVCQIILDSNPGLMELVKLLMAQLYWFTSSFRWNVDLLPAIRAKTHHLSASFLMIWHGAGAASTGTGIWTELNWTCAAATTVVKWDPERGKCSLGVGGVTVLSVLTFCLYLMVVPLY